MAVVVIDSHPVIVILRFGSDLVYDGTLGSSRPILTIKMGLGWVRF